MSGCWHSKSLYCHKCDAGRKKEHNAEINEKILVNSINVREVLIDTVQFIDNFFSFI